MAVTETLRALGGWGLSLVGAPQDLIDALEYYGHIAIHTGRLDYRVARDSALKSSRYTGVLRDIDANGESLTLGGPGIAMWLGDEDQKGEVIETAITITGLTFENAIRALLPDSVTEGTLFNIGKTYTGVFQFLSPREAIDYVCDTLGADWVVRGDATIDAGLESDLFVTVPKTLVERKESGVDMQLRAFLGEMATSQDVQDFTTRVLLLANGSGASTITATADIAPGLNPYKDLHGNSAKLTRIVSESSTDTTNAPARAQLQLNRFSGTRNAISLSTNEFDVKGDVVVGDYIWVEDPEMGIVDGNNQVIFRGKRHNPIKLRLTEMTWPISDSMSVGYRDWNGNWWNLTDYVVPETGATTLVVGGYNRSLTSGADGGSGGSRPVPDTSVPGVPTWVTPFVNSVYQSLINGDTKSQTQLKWLRPNNVDGSTIVDGDHYEIRYRTSSTPIFPSTWAQVAGMTWGAVNAAGGTWGQPIQYVTGPWSYIGVPFDQLSFMLSELAPNMPYEAQIRAVDGATPPNYGDWSATTVWQTSGDTLPPSTPAPPEIAASRIAVQVTHRLGKSSGGTYNLEPDLHHLNVYGDFDSNFTPSEDNLLGKIIANNGMISGQVPAVGSIRIETVLPLWFKVTAVDNFGNMSEPSSGVQQTALLIDDAHISDLTVSKVTAGTISADWILGAKIKTGLTGARTEMNMNGFEAYNSANQKTFQVESATGDTTLDGDIEMPGAVRIRDQFSQVQAELGRLADGSYGIALRNSSGTFLKLSDFIFGPSTAAVGALESTGSTSFTDLATFGPSVTVYIGPTRRCMIIISGAIFVNSTTGLMYCQVSGASSISAGTFTGSGFRHGASVSPGNAGATASHVMFLQASDGLNEGFNTFTLKYAVQLFGSGTGADFQSRRVTVFPY